MTNSDAQSIASSWLSRQRNEHILTFFLFNDAWGLARDLCTTLFTSIDSSLAETFTYKDQFMNSIVTTIGEHCITIRFVSFLSSHEAQLNSSTLLALEKESTSCILLTTINCSMYAASCAEAYAIEKVVNKVFRGHSDSRSTTILNLLLRLTNILATKIYSSAIYIGNMSAIHGCDAVWPVFHLLINTDNIPAISHNISNTIPQYTTLLPLYYLSSFYPSNVVSLHRDQHTRSVDSATRVSQATQASMLSDQHMNFSELLFLLVSKTNDPLSSFKDLTSQLSKIPGRQCSTIAILIMYSILMSFGSMLPHSIPENTLINESQGLVELIFSLTSFSLSNFFLPAGWNTLSAIESTISEVFSYNNIPEGTLSVSQFYSIIAQPSISNQQPTSPSGHIFTVPQHSSILNPVATELTNRAELANLILTLATASPSGPSYTTDITADSESLPRRNYKHPEPAPISSTFALSTVVTSVVDDPLDAPTHKDAGRRGKSIVLVEESDAGLHELQQGSLATPELYQDASNSRIDNVK